MTIEKSNEQIITLLCEGKTIKEIASIIFRSIPAVKKRLKNLREKNQCANNIQLVKKIIERKSIPKDTAP